MKVAILGVSISVFGIAMIQVSSGGGTALGLGISFVGVLVSLFACVRKDAP